MKLTLIRENINRFNERIKKYYDSKYFWAWLSFAWCNLVNGCSFDDYFRYEFYKKSNYERNKFITYRKSKKIIAKYNNSSFIDVVLNKVKFLKSFNEYINRKWLDTNDCSYEEFETFIKTHRSIIVKPLDSGSGRGIWKYIYNGEDDLRIKYNEIRGSLIEKVIKQNDILNKLNPSSLNTIRILTFTHQNNVNIVGCSLRMSADNSVVDNLHAGGICASVDVNTGIIFTPAINAKLEKFLNHPSSEEKIIGLEIPYWDLVISTVKSAALKIKDLRYLGWDVAILSNGVELIEANHDPAHDLIQMADQIGKYKIIDNK